MRQALKNPLKGAHNSATWSISTVFDVRDAHNSRTWQDRAVRAACDAGAPHGKAHAASIENPPCPCAFAACDDETREAVNRGFLFACEDASMQVIKFICETKKERR